MDIKCSEINCYNKADKYRKKCSKCRSREYSFKNPLRRAFTRLRANARRRNIHFGITLGEFKKFCDETEYLKKRGTGKFDLTIDRKKNSKGYVYSNMQVLTKSDNTKKRNSGKDGWSVDASRQEGDPF